MLQIPIPTFLTNATVRNPCPKTLQTLWCIILLFYGEKYISQYCFKILLSESPGCCIICLPSSAARHMIALPAGFILTDELRDYIFCMWYSRTVSGLPWWPQMANLRLTRCRHNFWCPNAILAWCIIHKSLYLDQFKTASPYVVPIIILVPIRRLRHCYPFLNLCLIPCILIIFIEIHCKVIIMVNFVCSICFLKLHC